jgi:hypothetical protein
METGGEQAGVLVLRAWVTDTQSLRIRITRAVGCNEPRAAVATSIDGTCAVIRAWLEDVLETGGLPGPSSGLRPK